MRGSKGFTLAVGVIASLALAAPAFADTEPNDVISQAQGPIGGGAPITGTLATGDDVDYYVFYAASQQQLHVTVDDLTEPDGYCLDHSLYDTDGSELPDDYTTAPGTNRYFIAFWQDDSEYCEARTYRFEIDPGSALVGGPALDRRLVQTGEPNETPGQAIGPLSASVNYVGSLQTENDEDWFWFWVPPGAHQFDASVTQPSGSPCEAELALYTSPGDDGEIDSADGGTGDFGHIRETLTGPATAYLQARSDDDPCVGTRWQFRIESPSAVSLTNPFPPPPPPKVHRQRFATVVKFRRRGARFSGRVVSGLAACERGRKVVLHRKGSGRKSFGSAKSHRHGTFTIRRHHRLRGWIYVTVRQRSTKTTVCRSGHSRRIRG